MEFRVLGPLEARQGDDPLPLGGRKQRAVLALLLLNANRVVSREHLIDGIWGDAPPESAVANVHVYVSRLRKLLGAETLLTRPPGYLLSIDPESVDVLRFEQLLAEARQSAPDGASSVLRAALDLWRGPALAEFVSEPFARTEGARLEEQRLAALETRIDADLALGRHADLVGEVERLVAAHPHREHLRGQLMLALYRSGRQAEALGAYRAARAALVELGVEPSDELRRLEKSILTQGAELIAPVVAVGPPALPGALALEPSFQFVGRARELASLRSLLDSARTGKGRVALVGGEAGSGKSRLVRELGHGAAQHGVTVLYGSCDPNISAPYQPFVIALEPLLHSADLQALARVLGSGRDELARLLPELGPPPASAGGDPAVARRVLHSAVGTLLAHIAHERPVVLIVDDLHWADVASLDLFRDLVVSTAGERLLLLGTYRDRSEDLRAEFSDALAALARVDGVNRLRLAGLSSDDVADFVRSSSGAEGGDVAKAIHALTEGTPFFLCELWRALVETDGIEKAGDVLHLTRPLGSLESPQGVQEVTHYRLSRLASSTTEMLELAAVAGPTFDLRVIERASKRATLAASLEEALSTGTIEELPGRGITFRFSHELVRRALVDRLSARRRAELHLRIGEALESLHADGVDRILPELAQHFTIAASLGGRERAAQYNVRASEAAMSLLAFEQAQDFAATALEYAKEGDISWARAQYLLASTEYYLVRGDPEIHAAAAAAAFVAHGDLEAAAEAEIIGAQALRNQHRGSEADAAYERAFELVRGRPASRAKAATLVWWSATLSLTRARHEEAVEYGREALALAEQLGLLPLQVAALTRIGTARGQLADDGGLADLERAIELGRGGAAPYEVRWAYNNLAVQEAARAHMREAGDVLVRAMDDAEQAGIIESLHPFRASLASNAFSRGHWQRAKELTQEYEKVTAASRSRHPLGELNSLLVKIFLARGRGDDAAALAHAEEMVVIARGYTFQNMYGRSVGVLAHVLVEQGRHEEAQPLVDELLAMRDERGVSLWWRWLIDLGWLLHDLGRPEPPSPTPFPVWNDAAHAIARGDLTTAVDVLAATDLVSEGMYARLRAAEQLAAAGDGASAAGHAEPAAAFYRSVDATAYLQRAEALLPAIARDSA